MQIYGVSGDYIYYALDFEPYMICCPINGEEMDLSFISDEAMERVNVKCDIQLCDSMKTAITTAMMDPSVISVDQDTIDFFRDGEWHYVTELGGGYGSPAFIEAVYEIMGFDMADIESHIQSHYGSGMANGMRFCIVNANSVQVMIENSDRTGNRGINGLDPIFVN